MCIRDSVYVYVYVYGDEYENVYVHMLSALTYMNLEVPSSEVPREGERGVIIQRV